jgi:Ca2+-binding EF-hand superfamily protein
VSSRSTCAASPPRLLAVIYNCFDEDGNGRLNKEELMAMLETINESKGALFEGNYAKAMEAIEHADL